jgi:hypothetical protein
LNAPFLVPALLRFPGSAARQDSWGRLLKLTAGGAELSTATRLETGENVIVRFELGGERLAIAARVHHAFDDGDGGRVAELQWNDMVERRRLAKALLDVLAKS